MHVTTTKSLASLINGHVPIFPTRMCVTNMFTEALASRADSLSSTSNPYQYSGSLRTRKTRWCGKGSVQVVRVVWLARMWVSSILTSAVCRRMTHFALSFRSMNSCFLDCASVWSSFCWLENWNSAGFSISVSSSTFGHVRSTFLYSSGTIYPLFFSNSASTLLKSIFSFTSVFQSNVIKLTFYSTGCNYYTGSPFL